ncbi:RHS repeat-associated core domain-containing protein [Methylobacter luteus]|uniref:RHS repeat-associated core domain-containing protein n=1 Tax=Methylobacter luteus TaxID=415 RepID=UPI00040C191B|nr:RHS repeat-associated core domain-containing protein [Methylobacter luteus]
MIRLSNQSPRYDSRTLIFLAVILLLAFFAVVTLSSARADPTSVLGATAEGVFGESSSVGRGEPDNKTGAMTYSYPFSLLSARGRPQPQLTLSYNSFSRDREAGYGWGVDLPVIERKPLSGNPCFTEEGIPIACGERREDANGALISEDRYLYNGQPLVFICHLTDSKLDNDQNCGKEPQPTWHSLKGWRYFRLQVEGPFIRFYLSPNRRYWKVQLKGGELLEFGKPPNSKTPGVEHAVDNENAILRWRLVRYSDAVHTLVGRTVNYIDYRWKRLGKRGLLFLTDIYDTPRASNHHSDADFAHHTQLDWQKPGFPQTHYADPYRATPDLRLSRVAVASMPWTGTGPREVIRAYFLDYAPAQGQASTAPPNPVFQLWHHSFLTAIGMHGRCNQFEDDQGRIPEDQKCPFPGIHTYGRFPSASFYLPPTTFEYEDGNPVFVIAQTTEVQGGPPKAVDENRVLPYLNSVGVVDFNRDGLPDIVQGWNSQLRCETHYWPDWDECEIARPLMGYLNRGIDATRVSLEHQCFDAGDKSNTSGLMHWASNAQEGLFNNTGGATIVGSWGEGMVAWSKADYAPYRARPRLPGSKPDEFEPGSGCDADHFKLADFNPGWEWEKTQPLDWAKPSISDHISSQTVTGGHGPYSNISRWFTDIDGDGLTDRFVSTGQQAGDFEVAYPEFTKRYAQNEPLPGGGVGPAQIPFVFDFNQAEARSLAPSVQGSKRGTKFFYVDINGDGLVDLVTQNQKDSGGIPRVRPGNGYGKFTCIDSQQPSSWPCKELPTEAASVYEIEAVGSRMPWPFTDDTFFHDVTGDGLADIIQYDMASGEVKLWVNQDGHLFACPIESCIAGIVQDHRTATRNIGVHRTTFADMNADGIDDVVILAKQGAYVGTFMKKGVIVQGSERGEAPRPGLLIRIHNGYGATTDIRYRTIQSLDLEVKGTPLAWQYHSPMVESVVTQTVTQDSYHAGGDSNAKQVSEPYQFRRKAQYIYRDPAYDRWSRTLAGFRKVVTRSGDEPAETATTYWFGPCQNNGLNARLPGREDTPLCSEGSDDEDDKSWTGRIVRIDRGKLKLFPETAEWGRRIEDGKPGHLWTKIFNYTNTTLFPLNAQRDRRVTYSYAAKNDTYLYDDAQPVTAGAHYPSETGGDSKDDAPHQEGIRKHLTRLVEYDNWGTIKRVIDKGVVVKDEDSAEDPDETTITLFSSKDASNPNGPENSSLGTPGPIPCTSDWQCLPDFVSIWQPDPGYPDKLLRKSRITYEPVTKDVKSIQGWLDKSSIPLGRHHPAGNNRTAPNPAGQSLDSGWHNLATLSYDAWGNVIQTASGQSPGGSPPSCIATVYDEPYQHLPNVVRQFKNGCGSAALETRSVFDRGFEQAVNSIAPNGSTSEIRFDPFGRPKEIYLPDPDATNQPPILAGQIFYRDDKPLSYIDVRHIVGPGKSTRSVTIFNGLGESVVGFDQGDNDDWVVKGWRITDLTGKVKEVRRPWASTEDPVDTAINAKFIPIPTDNSLLKIRYDDFGRASSIKENSPGFSKELLRYSYFPLALETRDAEQLKSGGSHEKAFQRVEYDGFGRSVKAVQHINNPVPDNITTTVKYNPTGEPATITRTHAGGTYQRTMEFDSLGRLMVNREPNTGNNWHYVWDDAGRLVGTSDARGCGENFYYDGLSRLIGEDYSPCLDSQAAYTALNLATGEGFEAFYRYDEYENDQVRPEPNFADAPKLAMGNLVAVRDRGSHTRFNYDARGRIRRVSRQIAKPEGFNTGSAYALHWYRSRRDYDIGDRLTRRTTGVDIPKLLMNGGSEERYTYSSRGFPFSIDSSYGRIINRAFYAPDGAPDSIVYGDFYRTIAAFKYDARRRLTRYDLANSRPRSTLFGPRYLTYIDYHFSSYDEVGNPLVIEDRSEGVIDAISLAKLPPDAAPVLKRSMEYDDLYRLVRIDNTYNVSGGIAPWRSPFEIEINTNDRHPVPLRSLSTRVTQQTFDYDGLGNIAASEDDLKARYERSLGSNLGYGTAQNGPNQLRSGEGLQVRYDEAGNLAELKIERPGNCPTGASSQCAQWFAYDWDEVGQLARARRWDFDGNVLPSQTSPNALPAGKPSWDLNYVYSLGSRIRKSSTNTNDLTNHTLEVFDTLRIQQAPFNSADGDYQVKRDNVHAYLGGMAHVFWDEEDQFPHQLSGSAITMHLNMGDYLGSSAVIINHAKSELVERTTYQPYGAVESDYRPKFFREPYKFTGKEEDIEVGATYFGARYYQPYLGRFMSADPLTIHGLGSDLNPYSYVSGNPIVYLDPNGLDKIPEGAKDIQYHPGGWSAVGNGQLEVGNYDPPEVRHAESERPSREIRDPVFFERGPINDAGTPVFDKIHAVAVNASPVFFAIGVATNPERTLQDVIMPRAEIIAGIFGMNYSHVNGPIKHRDDIDFEAAIVTASLVPGPGGVSRLASMEKEAGVASRNICPGGVCPCFAAGTPVATPDGFRPIESIKVGDLIISRDEVTGKLSKRRVVRTFITPKQKVVKVQIKQAQQVDTVLATVDHPFYVNGRGWTGAGYLEPNMHVSTASGMASVVGIDVLEATRTVYNLEVESTHTYFVGHLASWVHNSCYAKYNRQSDFGGAATRGPAARAIKTAAEGKPCPDCSGIMISGTRTQPVADHNPPLRSIFENGARSWTDIQRRNYANSPGAFGGASCLTCQNRQGALEAAKSRATYSGEMWFVGD